MRRIDTLIIGAGQAGLAVSHELTAHGRDHVLLERGQTAERWRSQSWDSLRLLTPNWMTRLPGHAYRGSQPDGFMRAPELVRMFERYARSFGAPVLGSTTVLSVECNVDGRYLVVTDQGTWSATNVVIATGATDTPTIPALARSLPPDIFQLVPRDYRNPSDLPPGGVLVVGASATGTQLADEFTRDGRRVVIAAGDHSRAPRRYRGRDLFFWLDRSGILDVSVDAMPDRAAAARAPSLQVVGGRDDLDLGTLAARGVTRAGRLLAADGAVVRFSDNLPASVAASERRLTRVLDRIDRYIDAAGFADATPDPDRPEPIRTDAGPRELNLRRAGINTVVWATGYRRDYSWLRVGVLDGHGEIEQRGGVTAAPGLYVIGLRFQTRRNSNFIDGVGHDARAIAAHIVHRTGATEVPSGVPTPIAV